MFNIFHTSKNILYKFDGVPGNINLTQGSKFILDNITYQIIDSVQEWNKSNIGGLHQAITLKNTSIYVEEF